MYCFFDSGVYGGCLEMNSTSHTPSPSLWLTLPPSYGQLFVIFLCVCKKQESVLFGFCEYYANYYDFDDSKTAIRLPKTLSPPPFPQMPKGCVFYVLQNCNVIICSPKALSKVDTTSSFQRPFEVVQHKHHRHS